jgi:hypothetical protein
MRENSVVQKFRVGRAVKRCGRAQWTVHGQAGTRIEALSIEQVVELFVGARHSTG